MARLGREDWVTAGLAALRESGPDAVAVQTLAPRLGATKGSFYWHFGGRDELLDAVLERWRDEGTEQVIARLEALRERATAAERLERLFRAVTTASETTPGEQRILAATGDPVIGGAVRAAVERRIGYVAELLEEAGLDAAEAGRRALLAYMLYLGHAQLAAIAPGRTASRAARRAGLDDALGWVLAPHDRG